MDEFVVAGNGVIEIDTGTYHIGKHYETKDDQIQVPGEAELQDAKYQYYRQWNRRREEAQQKVIPVTAADITHGLDQGKNTVHRKHSLVEKSQRALYDGSILHLHRPLCISCDEEPLRAFLPVSVQLSIPSV